MATQVNGLYMGSAAFLTVVIDAQEFLFGKETFQNLIVDAGNDAKETSYGTNLCIALTIFVAFMLLN